MVENISDRMAFTKFRLSNHSLMIEKGRHQNMNLFDRTCPFCPGEIENEFHFLIKCPVYEKLRQKLLNDVETLCIGFSYPRGFSLMVFIVQSNNLCHNCKIYSTVYGIESLSARAT